MEQTQRQKNIPLPGIILKDKPPKKVSKKVLFVQFRASFFRAQIFIRIPKKEQRSFYPNIFDANGLINVMGTFHQKGYHFFA